MTTFFVDITLKQFYFVLFISAMPSVAATMNSIRESRSLLSLVSDESSTMPTPKKKVLSPSQSFDDTKERSLQNSRVEIVRLTMFRTVCITYTYNIIYNKLCSTFPLKYLESCQHPVNSKL